MYPRPVLYTFAVSASKGAIFLELEVVTFFFCGSCERLRAVDLLARQSIPSDALVSPTLPVEGATVFRTVHSTSSN